LPSADVLDSLDHVLLHRAGHEERSPQVHVHDQVPVGVGHLEQQVVAGDPSVVDQHDRRAELGGYPVDRRLHLLGVPDVGAHRQRPATRGLDRLHRVAGVVLLQVDHRHGEPVGGQPLRGGRTDTARGAGDDRDATVHEPTRSNSAARPWPPPMHIVSRP
jgi:hypothetical protein